MSEMEVQNLIPLKDAAQSLDLSYTRLYGWGKRDYVKVIKRGSSIFLARDEVERLKKDPPVKDLKDRMICIYCGLPFKPKAHNQKYCSQKCISIAHGVPLSKPEPRACVVCGKEFVPRYRDSKYCSQPCRGEAYKQRRGSRFEIEWQELREYILERDDFRCQDCGKFAMDLGLAIHHIKPLYKGGHNIVRNLITLCHKCHRKRHKVL